MLGHDHSSALLYGNERLPTISLTLALPDGRAVDLGQAPVIDQQRVAGRTGKVDHHWWRLCGAVFIGGALRDGQQALQASLAQAGGAGQVAAGIASTSNTVAQQHLGRALDTRPTIEVNSAQLCQVLLRSRCICPRCGRKRDHMRLCVECLAGQRPHLSRHTAVAPHPSRTRTCGAIP
jgi:type IV secretory pathway VirB10-like protein